MYLPFQLKEERDPLGVPSPSDPWLLDDVAQHDPIDDYLAELESCKPEPASRGEVAKRLLDRLDEFVKEEEPFSDWYEQQVDLPIFEELPSETQVPDVRENAIPTPGKLVEPKSTLPLPNDTLALLQEFETVFGEVEMSHVTLTPPESPTASVVPIFPVEIAVKQNASNDLQTLTQLEPVVPVPAPAVGSVSIPDIEHEMAVVEELVRTRVEDLVPIMQVSILGQWNESVSSSEGSDLETDAPFVAAPATYVAPPSPSSSSSFSGCEESDPEWTPNGWQSPSPSPPPSGKARRNKPYARPNTSNSNTPSRKRSSTGVEDKRLRKKEQNKNAATRYRMKKKAEVEVILTEEKGLQDTNSELQQKVTDLSREIKYLKGLMLDMLKAKGVVK